LNRKEAEYIKKEKQVLMLIKGDFCEDK